MSEYGIILFFTTSSTMRTEKLLKQAGLKIKLVPTPRQFSSDCGIALRFSWQDRDTVDGILQKENIEHEAVRELA